MVDEELEGDWVDERDFSIDRLAASSTTRRRTRPRARRGLASPNGDRSEFERFRRGERRARSARRASRRSTVKVTRGDLTPEQFRGLAQIMREYTGGYARTTVQQNFVLRWVRDEARLRRLAPARRARPRRRRRRRDHRRRLLPRHRQLQARDHQLDGAQPGDPGADRGDADHRSADPADPHQDVRLPQRLRPAPHRATSASTAPRSRSAAGTMPAYIPHLGGNYEGGEVVYGHRLKVAAARQARPRRGRALAAPLRGRAATTARRSTSSSSGSARRGSRRRSRTSTLPAEFNLETMNEFIDWNRSEPYKVERGEGECAI